MSQTSRGKSMDKAKQANGATTCPPRSTSGLSGFRAPATLRIHFPASKSTLPYGALFMPRQVLGVA